MSRIRSVAVLWPTLLLAVACDSLTDAPVDPIEIRVATITLEAVGDAAPLQATVTGSDDEPAWESLNPEIVAVLDDGTAVAVAFGTATVRAHVGSRSADGTVTVLPPVAIVLSELAVVDDDPSGQPGMSMRVRNLGGRGYYRLEYWKIDPVGRHQRVLHYSSDADAPVGMDIVHRSFLLDAPADWVMAFSREPLALDPVRTSCVRLDGGAECPSDLPEQLEPVDSLSVFPTGPVLEAGESVQLVAHVFVNDIEVDDRTVTWSTPTPDRISLSETGLVQGLTSGYGQVEATVEGVSFTVAVTVTEPATEPAPDSVAFVSIVTPGYLPIRLWTGQAWGLQARVLNAQAMPIEGHTVTWAVQDTSVAIIDGNGVLTAVGKGATTVSATAGGTTGVTTAKIYVHPGPVDSAELTFFGTLSDTSAAQVQRSAQTTWVDSLGVEHPAFTTFGQGHLDLDWTGASPGYEQRLTYRTYIYEDGLELVNEGEYVDTGSLRVFYDLYTGWHIYEMTSAATPSLVVVARYSLPGELAVLQPVGDLEPMQFYFKLQ